MREFDNSLPSTEEDLSPVFKLGRSSGQNRGRGRFFKKLAWVLGGLAIAGVGISLGVASL